MKHLRLASAVAILLLGGFVVLHSLLWNYRLLPLIPYLDHLYLQDVFFFEVEQGREFAFWHRLTWSNEHLMLFPMPLYWLDNELFAARGTLLISLIQLINLFVAAVLARIAGRSFGWGWQSTAVAFAGFAAAQFWALHGVNLFWPKQVHMYCMLGAFTAGTWAYARAEQTRDWRLFLLALACFAVSLFSFGYGIAACCGLLGVAVCRAPWRWAAALALLVAIGFAFYWTHMLHPQRAAAAHPTGVAWLLGAAEYALWFLSSPVVQLTDQLLPAPAGNVVALVLAGCGLAAALAFLARHLLRRGDLPPARTFAAVWLLATITGASLTTIARLGNDPAESRADRYAMIPVAFWSALLLAGLSLAPGRGRRAALLGTGLLVLPLLLASHLQQLHLNRIGRSFLTAGEMAILNQVDDPVPLSIVHPNYPTHLPRVQSGLAQRHWGIFAGPQHRWIGQPLAQLFGAAARDVRGSVVTTAPIATPGAVRVGGWAMAADAPPTWLVLVDGAGKVAGVAHDLGLPATPGQPPEPAMAPLLALLYPGAAPRDASGYWVGYARTADAAALVPYAVFADGTAAPLQAP